MLFLRGRGACALTGHVVLAQARGVETGSGSQDGTLDPKPRAESVGGIPRPIVLTSHPLPRAGRPGLRWGAADPRIRGPVACSPGEPARRSAIGAHSGSYSVYRALAIAAGQLDPAHRPDLTNTAPAVPIGPFPQWAEPDRIVSLDPWGHRAAEIFAPEIAAGGDIRPTIAVTRAHINLPEIGAAMREGRLRPDGAVLGPAGDVRVTKVAIEPVWFLPGVARSGSG